MSSFWARPDAQQALRDRAMDRRSLFETASTEGSGFEEVALDYCDRCGRYVEPGTTRPYTGDKTAAGARACATCIDEMRAAVSARETHCDDCGYLVTFHVDGRCPKELGPDGARAQDGER